MPTVSEFIHSSFRLIGAVVAGETLETNELDDAFISLNQMIQSWNTEGASLVGRKFLTVPIGNGNNTYALGGQPLRIESASSAISGADSPIEIVDSVGWEAVTEKAQLSIYIKKLYCDYLHPISTVRIWPTPRLSGQIEMWVYDTIAPFTALDQTIELPMGYEAGLRYNLAVNLAPEYGRPLDPAVVALAQQFKASLVQLNQQNHMRSQAPAAMGVSQ